MTATLSLCSRSSQSDGGDNSTHYCRRVGSIAIEMREDFKACTFTSGNQKSCRFYCFCFVFLEFEAVSGVMMQNYQRT